MSFFKRAVAFTLAVCAYVTLANFPPVTAPEFWLPVGVGFAGLMCYELHDLLEQQKREEKEREEREFALKMARLERGLPEAEEIDGRRPA